MTTFQNSLRRGRLGLSSAVVLIVATACSSVSNLTTSVDSLLSKSLVLDCPDISIPSSTANLVTFKPGGGEDLTDVLLEGVLADIQLECISSVDAKTKTGSMDINVRIAIDANRGPADKSQKATLPYYISIANNEQKILYREAFNLNVGFSGNRSRVQVLTQPVTFILPITEKFTNRYYTVFAGFLVNKEQLRFNRKRRKALGR